MQRSNLNRLLAILLAFGASACGTVVISDHEWCGDMGKDGATCFNTLSNNTRDIPKEQWDIERFGQVCGQADAYIQFKNALLKLCEDTGRCEYRVEREIKKFGRKVKRTKDRVMSVSR